MQFNLEFIKKNIRKTSSRKVIVIRVLRVLYIELKIAAGTAMEHINRALKLRLKQNRLQIAEFEKQLKIKQHCVFSNK